MANYENNAKSVFKSYIAPICVALLIFGAIAMFAGFGGNSTSGGIVNSTGSSSNNTTDSSNDIDSSMNFKSTDFTSNSEFHYTNVNSLNSASIVTLDDERGEVFKYVKNSSGSATGETFILLPFEEPVRARKVYIEFDIYLDSSNYKSSVMSYQMSVLPCSISSFISTIKTGTDGFSFGAMSKFAGVTPQNVTTVLAYDTWHTIKMDVDVSSLEDFEIKYYADDAFIGSTNIYTEKSTDLELGKFDGLYFLSNSSVVSTMMLDDVSVYITPF